MPKISPIAVKPEHPTSDVNVIFTLQTGWDGCCYASKTIEGSHFDLEMIPFDPPGPVIGTPVPFEIAWNVGRLETGEYQVTLTDIRDNTSTLEFSVAQGQNPFPIPSIGLFGALVLAFGLAWIAGKKFKNDAQKRAA